MVFRANTAPATSLQPLNSLFSLSSLFSKEKRQSHIREVPEFPSPVKVAGVRRSRTDEEGSNGKRSKHSLELIPLEHGPEDLGFMVGCDGSIGLSRKSPKKRGHPRGSRNKKTSGVMNFDSMASSSGQAGIVEEESEQAADSEAAEEAEEAPGKE